MRYNIVSLVGGINMDIEFSSKEELYRRVKPALRTKKNELIKLGTKNIREVDIWNFLIKTKWKNRCRRSSRTPRIFECYKTK